MNTTLSATEARRRFFEMVDLVLYQGHEFMIEKDGKPAVKVVPVTHMKSTKEIKTILKDIRSLFVNSPKRKYWSVIDTPTWKRKEKTYLKNLSQESRVS